METQDTVQTPPQRTKVRRGPGFWFAVLGAAFFLLCTGVLLTVLVVVTLTKNLIPDMDQMNDISGQFTETCIQGRGSSKIVVIPLEGMISDRPVSRYFYQAPSVVSSVSRQLEQAASDNAVKAVILEIDSPGGGITATDVLHREIQDFQKTGRKVVVLMKDIAASGGYYVAAGADTIIAHPTTITGSIGVVMMLFNLEGLYDLVGISDETIK